MMDETFLQDSLLTSIMEPLRQVEARVPQAAAAGRKRFLREARGLAQEARMALRARRKDAWVNFLSGVMLGLVLLFIAGCTSVATSYSLPGDFLYPLKQWGEEVHLALAVFPEDDLGLTMQYADRRLSEMMQLALAGQAVPEALIRHMQEDLEQTLWVALRLDDGRLATILAQVETVAEQQVLVVYGMLAARPNDPLLTQLAQRLSEQVFLADLGQSDPQSFRQIVRSRQQGGGQAGIPQVCNNRPGDSLLWVMKDTARFSAQEVFALRALDALRDVPARDEAAAQRGRERFLEEARALRQTLGALQET